MAVSTVVAPAAHAQPLPTIQFATNFAPSRYSAFQVIATGQGFAGNAHIRFDVQAANGTGPLYSGYTTATPFGIVGGSSMAFINIPRDTYCGRSCGYSAAMRIRAYQYSSPQLVTPWQPLTLHSMPTFKVTAGAGSGSTDPNVYLTATGSGYAPGGNLRIDVSGPSYFQIFWPTADSEGSVNDTVLVPKSVLYCGPACNHTATLSVDVWQYSGQQLDPGAKAVTVGIPPEIGAQQTGTTLGVYPNPGLTIVTATGSGMAPNGNVRVELVNPARPSLPFWAWPTTRPDGTFSATFSVPTGQIALGCGSTFTFQVRQYSSPSWTSGWQSVNLYRPGQTCTIS